MMRTLPTRSQSDEQCPMGGPVGQQDAYGHQQHVKLHDTHAGAPLFYTCAAHREVHEM